ncbi:expressed unknown protein [Seminavis robusta]|uniref:Uncharacterized protein n=1 Tax=Seminavis robusta TaxID=568900 RepID=A0A9N8HK25_9STRA|nr:expressed unknown protein [Seminavis robusta]|eukprot:Sro806_g205150.1 n/a (498) ;mRNA; r:31774-33443
MKFVTAVSWIAGVSSVAAFAGLSTFTGRPMQQATGYRASWLMYENSPDGAAKGGGGDQANVWSVLAHTERWICETLASTETDNGNPYSRKEVNYVCETNADSPMIAANMFKRLREARELGQRHGKTEADHKVDQGSNYRPHTLRQTQVMVIPGNENLSGSFQVFDDFINAVNTARRNARDYVTDTSIERLDQEMAGEEAREWSVSVNCAHLHPDFGKKSPEEELQQMKEEEESGEVDLHAQEYAEKRLLARQSPYPTVVVEVRATPPPDWGHAIPPPPPQAADVTDDEDDEEGEGMSEQYKYNRKKLLQKEVTASDIQKLEALFGKAAAKDHPLQTGGDEKKESSEPKGEEHDFYASIGKTIEEISPVSHMRMAQQWITENDEKFSPVTSPFTESESAEVDHAYEFVFTNLAMQKHQASVDNIHGSRRQYLVMPHFLSSSATSLEKFTKEVMNIVKTLPDLDGRVKLSTFHPEHVQQERRSPLPIICLQWTEGNMKP